MTLPAGKRLGDYEIVEILGEGGMGEVYRARDSKLGREVALKTLRGDFAEAERRHRFEREARLLASLSHPHVAMLHGFFEEESTPFLVMELVAGETLQEKLARGALLIDEAVKLFRQIADGLAAAHEKGIIHRDLKPANIKITPDGRAKVLDFGLAKALAVEGPEPDLSQSPTASAGETRAGVILGTASYMSPEQARGLPLDRRTDVWSFGCVLYEALTGRAAFGGNTVTDVLAAIVGKEPDWGALPEPTPWRVRDLLRRCLRKDPTRRLDQMSAARLDLEDASDPSATEAVPSSAAPRRAFAGYILALALGAVAAWSLLPRLVAHPEPVTRFAVELPPGRFIPPAPSSVAISRDGRHIVYVDGADRNRLYWRPMDRLESTPLPGTENARSPFFSADGRSVGFFDPAEGLKKVSLEDGLAVVVVPDVVGMGGAWTEDNTIFFAGVGAVGLWRVSSDGGEPEKLSEGDDFVRLPNVLPGGKAVLYEVFVDERQSIVAFDVSRGVSETLVENAGQPHYADSGQLVFARPGDATLYAVAFDPNRLETRGTPVALGEFLDVAPNRNRQFSMAPNGDLVMRTSGAGSFQLVWVDRDGTAELITSEPQAFSRPGLSGDGTRVIVSIAYPDRARDLWLYDLVRQSWSRFTFDAAHDSMPLWSPDDASIIFLSNRSGRWNLHAKRSDGTGDVRPLTDVTEVLAPTAMTADGERILAHSTNQAERDIRAVSLTDGAVDTLVGTDASESHAVLSPDGRWLAYVSDDSGRSEIYVRPYPSLNGIWQLSTEGGSEPRWSRNGRELYYRDGSRMMGVRVDASSGFRYEPPALLFDGPYELDPSNDSANYDVSVDGRFLMVRRDPAVRTRLTVVLGFAEILKEKVPK